MITPPVDELAPRLAEARQQLAERAGSPSWPELTSAEREAALLEASNYLKAAAAAGIAVAAVDLARDVPTPARVTATVRDFDNRPLDRDDYASHLEARAGRGLRDERLALLSSEEGQAVAALLDELAGVYRDEDLGRLARTLAVRINDRLGI